jgi:hypothetical protein
MSIRLPITATMFASAAASAQQASPLCVAWTWFSTGTPALRWLGRAGEAASLASEPPLEHQDGE